MAPLAGGRRMWLTYNHMVVGLLTTDLATDAADRVFHALADATRRDIVQQALVGEHSVSALARRYPMSVTAVQKHVAVLEAAELVTKERRGREQLVRSNVDTIRRANELLEQLEGIWHARIDQIGELLAEDTMAADTKAADSKEGSRDED